MRNFMLFYMVMIFAIPKISAQGFPWEHPLKIVWSSDGMTFSTPSVFQDSSGVPSIIHWKGDTLVCAFQWFRAPIGSLSWDRVAVKFSYDNGMTWTPPEPIIMNGFPGSYQRPFDPTLVAINKDSLQIYFSSSDGLPSAGLDSIINTYSAVSIDGIHFSFEANARVDEPSNRVIDPAVIQFENSYHYIAPIGSPQQGAYHYLSPDGLNFMKVPDIPSDNNHNWTGNYLVKDTNELRFYGSGPFIWYNSTANGGIWNGYVATNIQGGDPSVVKTGPSSYLMVFVGGPYAAAGIDELYNSRMITVSPNPANDQITICVPASYIGSEYVINDLAGKLIAKGIIKQVNQPINISSFPNGFYLCRLIDHADSVCLLIKK